jgi:hypothetical protein
MILRSLALNVFDLIYIFEEKVSAYYLKRKKTEHYYNLIREQILIMRLPLAPVRKIYNILKTEKGCDFSYQYYNRIIEQNWAVTLIGNTRYIVVASEKERLCAW